MRSAADVPAELKVVHIAGIGEFAPLSQELKKVLQRSGTQVLRSAADAQSVINIIDEKYRRRVLSVDAQGRAAEYELIYSFRFDVKNIGGEVIVPSQKIELLRDFRFDPSNVLAADAEEGQIRKDMNSMAVRQMMRRIESHFKSGKAATPAS